MNTRRVVIRLSSPIGDAPPSQFRIFAAGVNQTTKGAFIFDATAAASVMADYEKHGADIMLDLEHLSVDDTAPHYDPDARGWAKLELRKGELWAVDVKWTPDGEARLLQKRQRYISPAFVADKTTKRVVSLLNVAITSLPATDALTPLVRANTKEASMALSDDDTKLATDLDTALKAVCSNAQDPTLLQLAQALAPQIEALIGSGAAAADPNAPSAAAPAQMSEASPAAPPAGGAPAGHAPPSGAPVKKVTTEYHSMISASMRAAGRSPAEIEAAVKGIRATEEQHDALASEVMKLRQEADGREVRDLVIANRSKITPHLEKWALAQSPSALKAFLEHAPVVVGPARREPAPKVVDDVELTKEDLELCRQLGTKPADVLASKKKTAALVAGKVG